MQVIANNQHTDYHVYLAKALMVYSVLILILATY